ncbi:MAG: hypothetical protein AAF349_18520 [Cyanobacteria bacterium P01_A01_bin.68]
MTSILFFVPAIIFLLYILASLVYLFISWRIARFVAVRSWFAVGKIFQNIDGSNKIKLISFTIAAVIVPGIIPQFFSGLLLFCYNLLQNYLASSLDRWREVSSTCNLDTYVSIDPFDAMYRLGGNWIAICGHSILSESTNAFLSSFRNAFLEIEVSTIPFQEILIFLTISFLCAGFMASYTKNQVVKEKIDSILASTNNFLSNPIVRSNLAFFLVLGVGLYLSIASIAAIPNLQASNPSTEEASVENLKERLEETLLDFRRQFFEGVDKNLSIGDSRFVILMEESNAPLTNLNELLKTSNSNIVNLDNPDFFKYLIDNELVDYENLEVEALRVMLGQSVGNEISNVDSESGGRNESQNLRINTDSPKDFLEALDRSQIEILSNEFRPILRSMRHPYHMTENFIRNYDQRRNTLIERSDQSLIQANSKVESYLNSAVNNYDISRISRIGDRETFQHYLSIISWYDTQVLNEKNQFSSCLRSIRRFDEQLSYEATKYETGLNAIRLTMLEDPMPILLEPDPLEEESLNYLERTYSDAVSSCDIFSSPIYLDGNISVPPRPELGQNLGPFRFVASWLLKTESLPLALITGLLGFGLLGAACSSFIQKQLRAPSDQKEALQNPFNSFTERQLVEDLTRIIVIGFSAAILAFLSILGGVSIFSENVGDPNPYSVLLICLIASVFGETIWRNAQTRLDEDLPDLDEKKAQTRIDEDLPEPDEE